MQKILIKSLKAKRKASKLILIKKSAKIKIRLKSSQKIQQIILMKIKILFWNLCWKGI